MKVTLDTSVVSDDEASRMRFLDLMAIASVRGIDVAVVTVTEREVRGTGFHVALKPMADIPETGVWDESEWGHFLWAGPRMLEEILRVLSNGAFPSQDARVILTEGQRRQLRDAMILEAHVREGRDVFVSEDKRAFFNHGRREILEKITRTRIASTAELLAMLDERRT